MSTLEGVYAAPAADEDDGRDALTDEDDSEPSPTAVWYAVPLWRLWLLSLLGGGLYQGYWMYRCWRAFRASHGYSRHALWQARYEATGFRVSPFWRAALSLYTYCFLLVVQREARLARVTGFGPPALWFGVQLAALTALPLGWNLLALSLAFLPAQAVVNRLHDELHPERSREPVSGAELCWLAVGLLVTLWAARTVGWW